MRIGRLIAVSILSITALTAVLGAGVLLPQYRTFTDKTEAIKAVDAFAAVLIVGQQVAGHRAPYVGPLFQDGVATPAQLEAIAKSAQASDAAFAKARTAVSALSDGAALVEGLDKAAAKLADLRTATDRVLTAPDERARPGNRQGIPAGRDAGDRDHRACVEPSAKPGRQRRCVADGVAQYRPYRPGYQDHRRRSRRHGGLRDQHAPRADGSRTRLRRSQPRAGSRSIVSGSTSDVDQIGNPRSTREGHEGCHRGLFRAGRERRKDRTRNCRPRAAMRKYTVNSDEWADIVVPAVHELPCRA